MRRVCATSPSRRHTGNEPRDWISSTRPSARSLATTLPAAPPVRLDGRSRARSSRWEAAASSRSWVSVSFTESSIRLRRRLTPPPPKPRNGPESGVAGYRRGVVQTKENYERIQTTVNEMTAILEETYSAAAKGVAEYNLKLFEIARAHTSAVFDFTCKLVTSKSPLEVIEFSTAHGRRRFETVSTQNKELLALAQKVA